MRWELLEDANWKVANHKDYLIRFLQVLREICSRGIAPTVSYDKRDDIWNIHDETPVQADFVNACQLRITFKPGEIHFEVNRLMKDDSKMIKQNGEIPLEGDLKVEFISAYLDDLKEYGIHEH